MRYATFLSLILTALTLAGCAAKDNDARGRDGGGVTSPPARQKVAPSRPTSVTGTEWYLVRLGGEAVTGEPQFRPRFLLDPGNERRVTGSTGINAINGTYELSGGALQFGPVSTTRRAGRPETMATEGAFLDALKRTATAEIKGNTLTLRDAGRASLAEFRALDAMP